MQQRVGDGVLVDLLGELEAGVLPAVAERLVGARSVAPRARPELLVIRIVHLRDGVREAGRFHRGHRARQGAILVEHSRAPTAEGDPVEPEGLRRIATEQANDQVEHRAAISFAAEAGGARNVEAADDILRGADEDRCRNGLVHAANHQGRVAASGERDESSIPSFT